MLIRDDETFCEDRRRYAEIGGSKEFLERVREWAATRQLAVVNSQIVAKLDAIEVVAPIFEMTPETAVVRCTALHPANVRFELAPKTWQNRLGERLDDTHFTTDDPAFDNAWHIVASDDDRREVRTLLDDGLRQALLSVRLWCRTTYEKGSIETILDVPELAGTHLLDAMTTAAAIARAQLRSPASSTYR